MKQPLLRKSHIIPHLDADNCETALRKIIDFLPEAIFKGINRQKILKLLLLREQIGTTAIGQGIALPHCFSSDIDEPIVAFGISRDGIPYASLDGNPVYFIFVLILPISDTAEQMKRQILHNIKWSLCDRYLQERLRQARTASEVFELFTPEPQQELVAAHLVF